MTNRNFGGEANTAQATLPDPDTLRRFSADTAKRVLGYFDIIDALEAETGPASRQDHLASLAGRIQRMSAAADDDRPIEASIIIPVCAGRRGHPVVISWRHVAGIRTHPRGEGIDAYLRLHENEIRELAVTTPGVILDIDTPADYDRSLHDV